MEPIPANTGGWAEEYWFAQCLALVMAFSAGCISQPLQTHTLEEEYADQIAVAGNLTSAVGVSVTRANIALQDAAKTIAEDPRPTRRRYIRYLAVCT